MEALHLGLAVRVGFVGGFHQLICLGLLILGLLHNGGDILHGDEEGDAEARSGDFLARILGPVAVHQVVVLVGGKALDAAVAAVVIGNHQTLGRYHLSRATAAELDDGVFEGRLVNGIDFLRRELAARSLEVLLVHLVQEGQEPHSFVGQSAHRDGEGGDNS